MMYYELTEQTVVHNVATIPADVAEFIAVLVQNTSTAKIPASPSTQWTKSWLATTRPTMWAGAA
jgi:hypothetical protein